MVKETLNKEIMEIVKIIYWESRSPITSEHDTLVVSKKTGSLSSKHTNLEELLPSILGEHPELEATVEGTSISVPTTKMFDAMQTLQKYGIVPAAHLDLTGCGKRTLEPCVY